MRGDLAWWLWGFLCLQVLKKAAVEAPLQFLIIWSLHHYPCICQCICLHMRMNTSVLLCGGPLRAPSGGRHVSDLKTYAVHQLANINNFESDLQALLWWIWWGVRGLYSPPDSGGLWQNARQFFNLALCDGMLANFSILPAVTECSSICQFSPLWRNARQFFNLALCDGMLANFQI